MSMGFRLEMRHETVLWLDLWKVLRLCRANPYVQIPDSWWTPIWMGGEGKWKLTLADVEATTGLVDSPFVPKKNGRGGWQAWTKEEHLGRIRFFVRELDRGRTLDPLLLETLGHRRAMLREGWHRIAALSFVGRKKVRVSVEAHPDERKVDALRWRPRKRP